MDGETDTTASSLLASLKQGCIDYHGLYSRFSSYLQPISNPVSPLNARDLKPLAKKFASFFSRAVDLLSGILCGNPDGDRNEERDDEFLHIFKHILQCLSCLFPVFDEPYMLFLVRGTFLRCLVATGKYEKAETEADALLKDLKSLLVVQDENGTVSEQQILLPDPEVIASGHSKIITKVVMVIITSLCNCAINRKSERPEDYEKIMTLVEQVRPWIRSLDHQALKWNRSRFLGTLYTCAAFLTSNCRSFDCNLVNRFCATMLEESASCSFNELMVKATKICSCIDLNCDDGPLVFLVVLRKTLELSLHECKDQFAKGTKEFLGFVYCLHAQCARYNKLDFEMILEDINSALDLWSNIDIEHYTFGDGSGLVAKNMVPMLCSLMDLLSIKGYYKHHSRICELMAKIFKRESIPVQKLFALLINDRRLGHFCCGVQMDLELISDAQQNCDASAHFTEFWTSCLKGHKPSLSMFAQSLLVNCLIFPEVSEKGFEKSLHCKIGTAEIKQIVSSLISNPKSQSCSIFLAGYLYYDLSQRFLSEGKLFEALYYAKEAFNLRKKLPGWKYINSHKNPYDNLKERESAATEVWPDSTRADTFPDTFLSRWIILRCYLESTFQIGSIYESIGNGAEAEVQFRRGKEISRLQMLHSFEITFASSLCQLYRKQKLWEKAECELISAEKLLKNKLTLSCESCKIFLETTVNLQRGDLSYSRFKNGSQHALEEALSTYESAFENLDQHKLESSRMVETETNELLNSECKFCMLLEQPVQSAVNKKSSRNRKDISKELHSDPKRPMRTTRSRSCKTSTVTERAKPATELNNSKKMRKKPSSKTIGDCASYKRVCWACLMNRALDSGNLKKLLHLGVEFRQSSFLLSLQLRIARTSGAEGAVSDEHRIHSLYQKCIFLLFCRSPGVDSSEIHVYQLMELITDEQRKALSIYRALILYNMSLYLLKQALADQDGNIDESWFGPWICLLRGSPANDQNKELLVSTLINHLKSLTNSEVNPSLLKSIVSGSESLEDAEACILQLILFGGSFGHGEFSGKDRLTAFSTSRDLGFEIPETIMKVLEDAFSRPISVNREPVIFVLDTCVQMLPWESLPRLMRQEVYRMPSVESILLTLDRNYQRHKDKEREEFLSGNSCFPKVDPFDTYYLLNPSGDCKITEDYLRSWLEGLNLKGKTGVGPAREELGLFLRNRDMFFYFDHGDGTKYIHRDEIEKLEIRAAVLLMGCSSGALICKGNYAPEGTPLSYLFAGSPAVIVNLWDVTAVDIDKFSKAVVNSWLEDEGEEHSVGCSACAQQVSNNQKWCKECGTRRIASSIGKARDVCRLKMLNGAAPVCYGVPTIIKRKS